VPYSELWGIVEAVWMGLADAHAAGIIHRDLKPSNVFLEQRRAGRRVKILDFGISKLPKGISTESLTQVGQSLGTFSFMPPEQIGKAKNVDHRADIYACTTLVYQAMSGKLPYKAKNVVAMMELKNKSEPRTLGEVMSEPVDDDLEAFIAKGLSRNPDERFQSAQEALEVWRRLRPPGALSVTDLDASGSYSNLIDEPPSSSEAKTIVVRKPRLPQPSDQAPTPQMQEDLGYGAAAMLERPQQHVVPEPMPPMEPEPATQPTPQHGHGTSQSGMKFDLRASSSPAGQPGVTAEAPMFEDALPVQRSGARMLLALVLGAIGLMLVGFFTVALVLHLLG
jgi:serine/threonine-protein kinase